jgi:hypothetical protein
MRSAQLETSLGVGVDPRRLTLLAYFGTIVSPPPSFTKRGRLLNTPLDLNYKQLLYDLKGHRFYLGSQDDHLPLGRCRVGLANGRPEGTWAVGRGGRPGLQ